MSEYHDIGYDFEHTFSHTQYEGLTAGEILQTLEEQEAKIDALELRQQQKNGTLKALAMWMKDDIIDAMEKNLEVIHHAPTRMVMTHHLVHYREILKDLEEVLDE